MCWTFEVPYHTQGEGCSLEGGAARGGEARPCNGNHKKANRTTMSMWKGRTKSTWWHSQSTRWPWRRWFEKSGRICAHIFAIRTKLKALVELLLMSIQVRSHGHITSRWPGIAWWRCVSGFSMNRWTFSSRSLSEWVHPDQLPPLHCKREVDFQAGHQL